MKIQTDVKAGGGLCSIEHRPRLDLDITCSVCGCKKRGGAQGQGRLLSGRQAVVDGG